MTTQECRHLPMEHCLYMVDRQCHNEYGEKCRDVQRKEIDTEVTENSGTNTNTEVCQLVPNEECQDIQNPVTREVGGKAREETCEQKPHQVSEPSQMLEHAMVNLIIHQDDVGLSTMVITELIGLRNENHMVMIKTNKEERAGFDLAIFARVLSKSFSNFSSSNFSSFAP